MYLRLALLLYWFECCTCEDVSDSNYTLIFKWNVVDFKWPTEESRNEFIGEAKFVPENCLIRDFKIWKNTAYVSLPRWKTGIPATLANFRWTANVSSFASPPLEPYPSWPMQNLDDCSALQSVHRIDVDAEGNLWALDSGVVEEFVFNRTVCPPKLVVFNLETNFVIKQVVIPSAVRSNSSLLATMALDKENKIAYIADSNYYSSGLVVYNHTSGTFRRFTCEQLNPDEGSANVNYVPAFIMPEFVSIALNTDKDKLYFSTMDSTDLLHVNTSIFATNEDDISRMVSDLGSNGRSSVLISDSKGYMYFNVVNQKAVAQWRESSWVYHYSPRILLRSKRLCHWISALDVDEDGYLWILSSRFHDYSNDVFKVEKDNMRIFRAFVPRQEKPKRPRNGFNAEYVVLILFIVIIGLIIIEILMFNSD